MALASSTLTFKIDFPSFYQWEDVIDEKYPHIVYKEHCKGYDSEPTETTSVEDNCFDEIEGLSFSLL